MSKERYLEQECDSIIKICRLETRLEELEEENNTLRLLSSIDLSTLECHVETIENLEKQLVEAREDVKTYKYDLDTLVAVLHDCIHNASQEECYDILKQVDEHYTQLKEKGDE